MPLSSLLIEIFTFLFFSGRRGCPGDGREDDQGEGVRGVQRVDHPGGDPGDEKADAQRLLLLVGRRHGLLRTLIQHQEPWRKQIRVRIRLGIRRGNFKFLLNIELEGDYYN